MRTSYARIFIASCALVAASSSVVSANDRGARVTFDRCSEFAGEGYVDATLAKRLVPHGYTVTGSAAGTAAVVVRITRCEAVTVDGGPAVPTILSQIGINIVSPDGTGTINNYELIYNSDNPYLVRAFQRAGVPARYDGTMTYEYTRDAAKTAGVLYAAVPGAGVPAYFIYGPETEPPAHSQRPFVANWWYGADRRVKQATTLPAIAFGTSAVTLYTQRQSILGHLTRGNAYGAFSLLSLRGEYDTGTMLVTVRDR